MTDEITAILIKVFIKLRQAGLSLGIGELLDCAATIRAKPGPLSEEEIKLSVRLLWCSSMREVAELEEAWTAVLFPDKLNAGKSQDAEQLPADDETRPVAEVLTAQWPHTDDVSKKSDSQSFRPVPLKTAFEPVAPRFTAEPDSYTPVSRRFMAYIWRYLRQPLHDGPSDILDVDATIENAARRGFYLGPVHKRRSRNSAHLLVFVDRGGSMVPFHKFSRDLVDTAQHESDLGLVEVFYFHNVPGNHLYFDPLLTEPLSLEQALENSSSDTSVLLVSDAGAARGFRTVSRTRKTSDFLFQLRIRTQLIAWLNPFPEARWAGTSAQIISHLVPMFQMDDDGLSNAIDVVRGQRIYRRAIN